jgi:hypothetical protein
VPLREVHARRTQTIAREKIGLLDDVETDGRAVKAVMTMMGIDDAGIDCQTVEPTMRMMRMMTTLTIKIDVAIANADVVKDHPQMDHRMDRQADFQAGRQADLQVDLQVDLQAGLPADLQEDLTTREQTAYIWSYPSAIAVTTDLAILMQPQRIAVGLSWS